jgi:colanic acid/amylovoran biosynthesis glycosyltransferase
MNRPLRIATFVGAFPVPSETFILRQITGLLDLGHEVDLYADARVDSAGPTQPEVERYRLLERTTFMDLPPECAPWELPAWPEDDETWVPGASEPIPNRERLARAECVKVRCHERAPALTEQVLNEADYGYRARSLSALHRLDRLCSIDRRYHVLHAHFGPVGESFRFARELWKAPLVVSFHGYDFSTVPRREGRDCYARLFEAADLITVNSDFTRGEVHKLGCPEAKLRKLPMGLDPGAFEFKERRASGPVRLITVARLVEIKGHEFCLRAVAEARRNQPELHYDIVGDGPQRKKLEALTDELMLRDIVTFHGTQTGPALKSLLDAAHLLMLCSVNVEGDQEGQGLALLEAQACGLPVIATRHGALPEGVLDDKSGWLVPERDVPALAGRIGFALDHAGEWPAMGIAGRRFAEERFDIRELNRQLVSHYDEAVAGYSAKSKA